MSLGSATRISLIKSAGLLGILSLACCAASSGSSRAADLSGPCCADLEERIAELESAAVRKGNRKVELTISGWVAEQIVHWRDPGESNTYVTSLGTIFASNFTLTGRASISKDTAAGFKLQIEFDDNNVYTTTQDRDNGPAGSPVVYAHWFLHSGTFGKLSLGKVSPADDSAVVSIDGSGTVVAAYGVAYDVFSFGVRGPFALGDSLIWGNAASCRGYGGGPGDCNGLPSNAVRYDSPSFAGFSATASWGEDDNWALAARYAGETRDFKLAGIVTYSETSTPAQGAPPGGHLAYTQASFYLEHLASGGFIDAAWGRIDEEPNRSELPCHRCLLSEGRCASEARPSRCHGALCRTALRDRWRRHHKRQRHTPNVRRHVPHRLGFEHDVLGPRRRSGSGCGGHVLMAALQTPRGRHPWCRDGRYRHRRRGRLHQLLSAPSLLTGLAAEQPSLPEPAHGHRLTQVPGPCSFEIPLEIGSGLQAGTTCPSPPGQRQQQPCQIVRCHVQGPLPNGAASTWKAGAGPCRVWLRPRPSIPPPPNRMWARSSAVEHLTFNQRVVGSNPTGLTSVFKCIAV